MEKQRKICQPKRKRWKSLFFFVHIRVCVCCCQLHHLCYRRPEATKSLTLPPTPLSISRSFPPCFRFDVQPINVKCVLFNFLHCSNNMKKTQYVLCFVCDGFFSVLLFHFVVCVCFPVLVSLSLRNIELTQLCYVLRFKKPFKMEKKSHEVNEMNATKQSMCALLTVLRCSHFWFWWSPSHSLSFSIVR